MEDASRIPTAAKDKSTACSDETTSGRDVNNEDIVKKEIQSSDTATLSEYHTTIAFNLGVSGLVKEEIASDNNITDKDMMVKEEIISGSNSKEDVMVKKLDEQLHSASPDTVKDEIKSDGDFENVNIIGNFELSTLSRVPSEVPVIEPFSAVNLEMPIAIKDEITSEIDVKDSVSMRRLEPTAKNGLYRWPEQRTCEQPDEENVEEKFDPQHIQDDQGQFYLITTIDPSEKIFMWLHKLNYSGNPIADDSITGSEPSEDDWGYSSAKSHINYDDDPQGVLGDFHSRIQLSSIDHWRVELTRLNQTTIQRWMPQIPTISSPIKRDGSSSSSLMSTVETRRDIPHQMLSQTKQSFVALPEATKCTKKSCGINADTKKTVSNPRKVDKPPTRAAKGKCQSDKVGQQSVCPDRLNKKVFPGGMPLKPPKPPSPPNRKVSVATVAFKPDSQPKLINVSSKASTEKSQLHPVDQCYVNIERLTNETIQKWMFQNPAVTSSIKRDVSASSTELVSTRKADAAKPTPSEKTRSVTDATLHPRGVRRSSRSCKENAKKMVPREVKKKKVVKEAASRGKQLVRIEELRKREGHTPQNLPAQLQKASQPGQLLAASSSTTAKDLSGIDRPSLPIVMTFKCCGCAHETDFSDVGLLMEEAKSHVSEYHKITDVEKFLTTYVDPTGKYTVEAFRKY